MTSKHKNFLISSYIIIGFVVLVILAVNYIIMLQIGFSQIFFFPITVSLICIAIIIYRYLSKSIFEELFKSDKQIDDMLKKTLHELNTPVATIKMNIQMIKKNIETQKDKNRILRIENACNNLLELYEYMEYEISSKIDTIKPKFFDISESIQKAINKVEDIRGDIQIINNSSSDIVNLDMQGFLVVVDNLISNAIKYNKSNGKIIISNKNHILKIEDTGYGIDTKNIFKIYDKYFQVDSSSQGIGLGLSVVKKYCDNNKIIIKIDTKSDIGTVFYLNYESCIKNSR